MSVHLRPQARRRLRYLADLAGLVATPLVPADYLDMVDPLRAGANELRGRVTGIRRLTDDAVAIDITPGRAWRGHRAGQYLRVGVDIDGVRHWRTYSLTSPAAPATRYADRSPERLSIAVKAVPGGLVSTHLVRRLRAGELLYLGQATGDFVLPDPPPARVAFITGGSGITPVLSHVENILTREPRSQVTLFFGNRTTADVMFLEELEDLKNAHMGRFQLVHVLSREPQTVELLSGRMDPERLDRLFQAFAPVGSVDEYYLCGPFGMVEGAQALLASLGVDEAHVHHEVFHVPVDGLSVPAVPAEDVAADAVVTVTLDGRTSRIEMHDSA